MLDAIGESTDVGWVVPGQDPDPASLRRRTHLRLAIQRGRCRGEPAPGIPVALIVVHTPRIPMARGCRRYLVPGDCVCPPAIHS